MSNFRNRDYRAPPCGCIGKCCSAVAQWTLLHSNWRNRMLMNQALLRKPSINIFIQDFYRMWPRIEWSRVAFLGLVPKTIFVFVFFDTDWKIVFLILYRELFVSNPGALKICLFRVAFFFYRIASPKGYSGEFLDINPIFGMNFFSILVLKRLSYE